MEKRKVSSPRRLDQAPARSEAGRRAGTLSAVDHSRQRWARILAADHRILLGLLDAASCADSAAQHRPLLQLALDFHGMHREFEAALIDLPQLRRIHLAVDELAEQVEHSPPGTALYRARGAYWSVHLRQALQQEEQCFAAGGSWQQSAHPWSQELLRCRHRLMRQVAAAMAGPGPGQAS